MNWEDEMELQRKIRSSRANILKYGTYTMTTGEPEEENETEEIEDALPDYMPARTEDFIQNNIDSLMKEYGSPQDAGGTADAEEAMPQLSAEEDAKVAEILAKFEHNIQNNVNSLFDH